MKKYREINLEENASSLKEALDIVKNQIKSAKENNIGCLMFIHGYGSSGKGGIIRVKVREWLDAQQRNGSVKTVIYGERFEIFNEKALKLKNTYKELEPLLHVHNDGVTVVEI